MALKVGKDQCIVNDSYPSVFSFEWNLISFDIRNENSMFRLNPDWVD